MDVNPPPLVCPKCHIAVRTTDYFCYNCGANLRPKPLSTSIITQLLYYIGSIILFPMGIVWGFRYARQSNAGAKIIGWILIIITIVELVVVSYYIIQTMNTVNEQITKQMRSINY